MIHTTSRYLFLTLIFTAISQERQLHASGEAVSDWYSTNALARNVSQLSEVEVAFLDGSDLIHYKPIVLPTGDLVLTGNDYFDLLVATQIDETVIVLFDRRRYHWGSDLDESLMDEHSGIRMMTTSNDGGETWSKPIDVFEQAGTWERSLSAGSPLRRRESERL